MKQSTAVKVLAAGENVFLTGAPGAGKTHLLNRFIKYLRDRQIPTAITASTGIAATHIGGTTLHSWSGLGIRDAVDPKLLENLFSKKYLKTRFEKTKVLIIDEVSMLSPALFSAVSEILQNFHFSQKPFGGLQIVLSGDFFQLPPVSKNSKAEKFIWQSDIWKKLDPKICYLSERFRHSEKDFLKILDEMRAGKVSAKSREILRKTRHKNLKNPTRLLTHNADVDAINSAELFKIKNPEKTFSAKKTGNPKIAEKLLGNSLFVENLKLKKDALVMFLKNNPEKGVVNGTLGKIVNFTKNDDFPVVETTDGRIVVAEPASLTVADERGKKLAEIAQIPLRLAWAITVHKSQGMTLDAAEIDLSRAFEAGHGYVAISRVRNLDGLKLSDFNEMALSVDPDALFIDAEFQKKSQNLAAEFAKKPIFEKYQKSEKSKFKTKIPTIEITRQFLEKGLSFAEIAAERDLKKTTILNHFCELLKLDAITFPIEKFLPKKEICEKILTAKKNLEKRDFSDDKTENGEIKLSAIFRELKKKVSYDEIKITLAKKREK